MNRHVGALVVLSCFLPAAHGPYAQQTPAPNLSLIKSLKCAFPLSVSTTWDAAGEPQVQVKKVRTDYLRYSVPGFVSQPEGSQHYGECEATR